MKTNDLILQTLAKLFVFVIITFSFYIFLAGHNNPGGGFIGGLMTSSALILLVLAFDWQVLNTVIPIDFKIIIALGLLIAVGNGLGSILFGVPFLTHTFGYFDLPLLGKTELATATIFDTGVYLVVVGVTMTILQSIKESE